jgi:hypothetical protein
VERHTGIRQGNISCGEALNVCVLLAYCDGQALLQRGSHWQ